MNEPANSSDVALVKGYRWCATMQLRTPLASLELHGRVFALGELRPELQPEWVGIWMPELKTWAELGIKGLRELPVSTMASDIGYIPSDGGRYLPFLIAFRRIVEGEGTAFDKIAAVDRLSCQREHAWVLEHHPRDVLHQHAIPAKPKRPRKPRT